MNRPSFFIVGAPKCGTTAMCDYLNQHPQLFIPPIKEPRYFGADLVGPRPAPNLTSYLRFFEQAEPGQRCGEGTVWYLFSQTAAEELRAFDSAARIIIMLRNPIDMAYSLHSEMIFQGDEDIRDFAAALVAEPLRRQGRRLVARCRTPWGLRYTDVCRTAGQVAHYFEVFERAAVHVVIYDDFAADPLGEYQKVLRFLGVDAGFEPRIEVVNSNKVPRNRTLKRFVHDRRVHAIARGFLPQRLRDAIARAVIRMNTIERPRATMDPAVRKHLASTFAGDVQALSDLLSRDLTHWCK